MITKFMGNQGFTWFVGNVEDNNDPDKLGRIKVRCHGYHTNNKEDLPTEFLPWATVLQPTTSGGIRGSGVAPVGIQVGTEVVGFFADGSVAQYPVVFGVLGGINNTGPQGTLPAPALRDRIESPNPPDVASTTVVPGQLGLLTPAQYQELKNTLGRRESNNNYFAENTLGYIGKYQFGIPALYEGGYVNVRSAPRGGQKELLNNPSTWTGKNGINSKQAWFSNGPEQERACDEYTTKQYRTLIRNGTLTPSSTPRTVAGYIAVAHLLGATGALRYKTTGAGTDAYGASGNQYFRIGFNGITDDQPKVS
jgi:hypothetical protein